MTFTYGGDPSNSDLEEIRFYLGDVEAATSYISDEEIEFVLVKYVDQYSHNLGFAALCAELMAAKAARQVNVSADGVSVQVGDLQARFNELATSLRDQYRSLYPNAPMDALVIDPYDPTIEPLVFGVGFTDNPDAGVQDMGRIGNYPYPAVVEY